MHNTLKVQGQWPEPSLFVLQVALFRQAEEWGLQAESVAGYGPAVAYAAGTLCLDDACTLVASAESSLVHKEPVIPIVTNSSIETTTVLELGENCLHPRAFLATVAEAHVHGTAVQFRSLFARTGARRIDLPTYAFQRKRYWLEDGGWRGGASN